MSAHVVAVLRAVRARIGDPRRWVQGMWRGHRDARGVVVGMWAIRDLHVANCWCLDGAINTEMDLIYSQERVVWTELRQAVAEAIHGTIGLDVSISSWNDDRERSHADVVAMLDATLARLEAAS